MTEKVFKDLVGFTSEATGDTGAITIDAALGGPFRMPAEASMEDGLASYWRVQEGDDWMLIEATYDTGTPDELTVLNVIESWIAGATSTDRMDLQGTAEVRLVAPALLFDGADDFGLITDSATSFDDYGSIA